ncbi:hypothetical protein PR048_001152 [Dryococelus australis]|uniref:Uncharacterized protein n=1 Tax=Dryococelus australis TaxID=614101 RepID=A0ABQ9IGP4_9NEOP|nr:hypothetical protein PR048_001152 [Dryococelus australis]
MSVFSDTCSDQNRNQLISVLFSKGHSYMEVDSMHSAIETARRNVNIYTMNNLLNVFHLARSTREKNKTSGNYIVKEL